MFFSQITAKLLSMPCIDHLHFDLLYYSKNTLEKKNIKKNMINSLMLKLHSSKPLNDKLVTVPKA